MSSGAVVYVVDDDLGVRKALSFLLVSAGLNVRLYESANTFLKEVRDPGRCCIVTDVRMPGIDGLDFIRRLNERGFNVPVIVMTGHADIPLAVEAMKAGAIDFLEKPFREDRFLEVVRFALVCDEKSVRRSQELLKTQARLQSLSQRERQVLDCLVAGKANKIIAHELNISIRTVEIHRSNVMAKMEARNLSELIRMALFIEATLLT
jgi:two-component system, LuxR family, response regulator FixJ